MVVLRTRLMNKGDFEIYTSGWYGREDPPDNNRSEREASLPLITFFLKGLCFLPDAGSSGLNLFILMLTPVDLVIPCVKSRLNKLFF